MNALDRFALATCFPKRANWVTAGIRDTWNSTPVSIARMGAEMLPGVGAVASGMRAVGSAARGEWGGALGHLGLAGLGLLPAGGIAGKGLMKFAPKTIGKLQQLRNSAGTGILGASKLTKPILEMPKLQTGLHTAGTVGAIGHGVMGGAGEVAEGAGKLPMDDMLSMAQSHVMQNPMYAQPSFNPLPQGAPSTLY